MNNINCRMKKSQKDFKLFSFDQYLAIIDLMQLKKIKRVQIGNIKHKGYVFLFEEF